MDGNVRRTSSATMDVRTMVRRPDSMAQRPDDLDSSLTMMRPAGSVEMDETMTMDRGTDNEVTFGDN